MTRSAPGARPRTPGPRRLLPIEAGASGDDRGAATLVVALSLVVVMTSVTLAFGSAAVGLLPRTVEVVPVTVPADTEQGGAAGRPGTDAPIPQEVEP